VSAIATVVVVAFGLLMIAFTVVVFSKQEVAERFLSLFASSARSHYLEQVFRVLAGAALVVSSPSMWQSKSFWFVGWVIVVSSAVLMCIPWQWHHRFGERVKPLLLRYLKLYAVGSFVFGVLLLYGVFAGSSTAVRLAPQ